MRAGGGSGRCGDAPGLCCRKRPSGVASGWRCHRRSGSHRHSAQRNHTQQSCTHDQCSLYQCLDAVCWLDERTPVPVFLVMTECTSVTLALLNIPPPDCGAAVSTQTIAIRIWRAERRQAWRSGVQLSCVVEGRRGGQGCTRAVLLKTTTSSSVRDPLLRIPPPASAPSPPVMTRPSRVTFVPSLILSTRCGNPTARSTTWPPGVARATVRFLEMCSSAARSYSLAASKMRHGAELFVSFTAVTSSFALQTVRLPWQVSEAGRRNNGMEVVQRPTVRWCWEKDAGFHESLCAGRAACPRPRWR